MSTRTTESADDDKHIVVNERLTIPRDEITFTFMRSSGPGGQNVNKVNTKVRLRWSVKSTDSLEDDVKERFMRKYRRRITTDGDFILTSQRYRDQSRNVADCLEKLKTMLMEVAESPAKRKKTKPSRASVRRRIGEKRRRSQRKQQRRPPGEDD